MINEAEPKFQSVHTRSTFDSTFGGWYTKWVPLSTKKIQSIIVEWALNISKRIYSKRGDQGRIGKQGK